MSGIAEKQSYQVNNTEAIQCSICISDLLPTDEEENQLISEDED